MMTSIRRLFRLLQVNWKTLVWFELIFKLATIALFLPLSKWCFSGLMHLLGYRYLTLENLFRFLKNPVTILALLLTMVLIAFYAMFDIGCVLYILDQSSQKRRVSVTQAASYSIRNALRVFLPWNLLMLPYLLLMLPTLNLGVASNLIGTYAIPAFVTDFLSRHRTFVFLSLLLYSASFLILFQWRYALHVFSLSRVRFFEACRQASALSWGHYWNDLGQLFLVQLVLTILHLLISFAGFFLIVFVFRRLSGVSSAVITSTALVFLGAVILAFAALSMPTSFAVLTFLLELRREALGKTLLHAPVPAKKLDPIKQHRFHIVGAVLLTLSIFGCVYNVYIAQRGHFNLDVEQLRKTEVSAHRGASLDFPENTMAAFQGAWEQQADWIELDVQQSKDGVIYVMHDSSLRRTTGVNRRSWQMSWEEISQLDAGYRFDKDYAGEPVPLLEEVIDFAKWRSIRLNIELKPTGHEIDFARQVVDLVREKAFEDDCVVTSQSYEILEQIKAYDPEISTVYVMAVAVGDIGRLTAADHFSIQASFLTKSLVSSIHASGKQVFAWTVDTEDKIHRMLRLGVDNIITNDVPLAKECINASRTSDVIQRLLERFLQL